MNKALLTILKYVVFLGLGIYITYHMLSELSDTQRKELFDAIRSINALYLIPISAAGVLSHYFRTVRWKYLLRTIDLHPTTTNTFFAVMIGYITNLALPRAGEVAKCTVLAKYEDMPAHKMVGTIVAERAFDVLSLIVISVTAYLIEFQRINDYISPKLGHLVDKVKSHEVVLIGLFVVMALAVVAAVVLYRKHKETKIGQLVKEMTHGIMSIVHMKEKWQFLFFTVLMWFMYFAQIFLGLYSLSPTHHLHAMASWIVLVYGSLGLIATPGGIGAYPYLVEQILHGPYNIPEVPAQAFGWIAWLVQTFVILLFGIISLLVIHTYNNRRNAKAGLGKK